MWVQMAHVGVSPGRRKGREQGRQDPWISVYYQGQRCRVPIPPGPPGSPADATWSCLPGRRRQSVCPLASVPSQIRAMPRGVNPLPPLVCACTLPRPAQHRNTRHRAGQHEVPLRAHSAVLKATSEKGGSVCYTHCTLMPRTVPGAPENPDDGTVVGVLRVI